MTVLEYAIQLGVLMGKTEEGMELIKLKSELEEKYNTSVVIVDCMGLTTEKINEILKSVLMEFPIDEIGINLPTWVDGLEGSHWLKGKRSQE